MARKCLLELGWGMGMRMRLLMGGRERRGMPLLENPPQEEEGIANDMFGRIPDWVWKVEKGSGKC